MNSTAAALDRVVSDLDQVLSADALAALSDDERMDVLRVAGAVLRRAEAVAVETVTTADAVDFPGRFGCRSMNELIQRTLRVDAPGAARVVKAAKIVHRDVELTTGAPLPARWPELRAAMLDGTAGVAGLLAATGPVEQAGDRIGTAERLWADAVLADHARGCAAADPGTDLDIDSPDAAPPATPDDLHRLAQEIAVILDPDGAEPSDRQAQSRRYLTIGRMRDGVYPMRGNLLPDTYAQLRLIIDAQLNPKVDGPPVPRVAFEPSDEESEIESDPFNSDPRSVIDPRTRGQKQHDALAVALGIAARHDSMPSLGGGSPSLVVQVSAADVAAGEGWARIPGVDASVPLSVAAQTACAGTVQRVLCDEGRVVAISVTDRVFTSHQRRAIVLRDGECLIPGCHVPASWCEIHHVVEYARGGLTSTDNGVPLCWWHHRSLDRSGWEIRMREGLPQIRGPAWWDPLQQWRTPRGSLAGADPARLPRIRARRAPQR